MIVGRRACCLTANYLSRFASSSLPLESYPFENKFSEADKERILTTLNSLNAEQLSRFKVTQTKLKSLIKWKDKKGPFNSLSDVLEVDGLGMNVVEKLCNSILTNDVTEPNIIQKCSKRNRNILTPPLTKAGFRNLTSAVGVHVESTGVSWAKLKTKNNELTNWDYCDFSMLPLKLSPLDSFNTAVKIVNEIPLADVYIFESKQANGSGNKAIAPYNNQMELTSMLLALINTRKTQDMDEAESGNYSNKVHYLKARLPARLFGALVGSEKVSTEATILNILKGNESIEPLPCSNISVAPNIVNDYRKRPKGYKDLLDQSLLLVIAFMDLCVYNNPKSFDLLESRFKRT